MDRWMCRQIFFKLLRLLQCFLWFSQTLAHMMYVPICEKWNRFWKFLNEFLKILCLQWRYLGRQACSSICLQTQHHNFCACSSHFSIVLLVACMYQNASVCLVTEISFLITCSFYASCWIHHKSSLVLLQFNYKIEIEVLSAEVLLSAV